MALSLLGQVLGDLLLLFEVGVESHSGCGLEIFFRSSQVIFARSADIVHDRVNVQGYIDEVVDANFADLLEALNTQEHVFMLEVSSRVWASVAVFVLRAKLHSLVPGVS